MLLQLANILNTVRDDEGLIFYRCVCVSFFFSVSFLTQFFVFTIWFTLYLLLLFVFLLICRIGFNLYWHRVAYFVLMVQLYSLTYSLEQPNAGRAHAGFAMHLVKYWVGSWHSSLKRLNCWQKAVHSLIRYSWIFNANLHVHLKKWTSKLAY